MVARILIAKHKMLKGLFCSCMWLDDFLHFTYSQVAQYAWKFFVSQKIIPAKTIWLSKDLYTCFSVMYDKMQTCLSIYYTVSTTVYVVWLKRLKISFKIGVSKNHDSMNHISSLIDLRWMYNKSTYHNAFVTAPWPNADICVIFVQRILWRCNILIWN